MHKRGGVLIALGVVTLFAALVLAGGNVYADRCAAASAAQAVQVLSDRMTGQAVDEEPRIPDYQLDKRMEMPTIRVDGRDYIGTLTLPTLSLEFPVISRWSNEALRSAPCRYSGSAYTGDMVLAAHNYSSHFGRLKELHQGDMVQFADVDGNVFTYTVAVCEVLPANAVEEMCSGEWALTLFTCTLGGVSRVTIRCDAAAE